MKMLDEALQQAGEKFKSSSMAATQVQDGIIQTNTGVPTSALGGMDKFAAPCFGVE